MKKILIIDDEVNLARAIKRYIQFKFGYEVMTKTNQLDAYELIKSNKVDLVISDTQMPVISGLDLKLRLDKENIKVPFIGMSANDYKERWNELGAGFLLKPIDKEELYVKMGEYL